jgi:hypothetical protein
VKSRRALSTLRNPDYEMFPKIIRREPGESAIQFGSKPIRESHIPMEVIYNSFIDEIRAVDNDKE